MGTPALHEFMSQHRDEILRLCAERIRRQVPERSEEELVAELPIVLDEIIRALEKEAGLPVQSPLPGKSQSAARHGSERQLRGYKIPQIAMDFGAISDSMGQLGAQHGLSFDAREYQVFNQCIDIAISTALEQFSVQAHQQQEDETTQRIGFLAHELRNALANARTSFSILQSGQLGLNSRTGHILDRSLGRLESLISQMLLAVQLHGGVKPQLRRLRIGELLRDIAESSVPERGIRLVLETEEALELDADERLLVSAVSNLLQNAFKFTRNGGQISLRAHREGADVVVEVEDECGGLPPGREQELFRPYVQLGSDRRGLGLGLAITREAIEVQQGVVTVRNLPGKGCIFSVRLPAQAAL